MLRLRVSFLRFGVGLCYVWGLGFLRLEVSQYYVSELLFVRLGLDTVTFKV